MVRTVRQAGLSLVLLSGVACGGGEETTITTGTEGTGAEAVVTAPVNVEWPSALVTGPGTGPALFLGAEDRSPAIGYVRPGVDVELAEQPVNGRALVRIRGSIKVRAHLVTSRLGLRVQQRGKIGGTEVYVGPGDFVRYLGPSDQAGIVRVEAMPQLTDELFAPAFEGVYPMDRLAATAPPADAERPTAGTPRRLPAGTEVPLYDRPGGAVVATLPASDPGILLEVVRDGAEWKGVRVGQGPYLVGYVNVALGDAGTVAPSAARTDGIPDMLRADAEKPLVRIAAGTRVRSNDQTVAILEGEVFARELARFEDGTVDVFVANDSIGIRGAVPAASVSAATP
ncbi:MAG: hypothetical protein H6723_06805 [Sandaracinus sp.]|nr:hypothetical protein [Sandaracinus sp.]